MYVYCAYQAMFQKPKRQLPNCLKIEETSVVLIVFDGVLCEVCFLPFLNVNQVPEKLYLGQWPYVTNIYLGQWPYVTNIYLVNANLPAQIERVQDNINYPKGQIW